MTEELINAAIGLVFLFVCALIGHIIVSDR